MNTKNHSRSLIASKKVTFLKKNRGVFTMVSPDSWNYRRLVWYTTEELKKRSIQLKRAITILQNQKLIQKIEFELRTIKSILS